MEFSNSPHEAAATASGFVRHPDADFPGRAVDEFPVGLARAVGFPVEQTAIHCDLELNCRPHFGIDCPEDQLSEQYPVHRAASGPGHGT